ncbi:hypothetical protein TNIN_440241 [Trichonephila inaurata madagascariensis]|uniref:Uncharacterized protein n=1 Tax=Trichonephila inaurata madagascariensis TaxID=2747483 RepID=A0A8X6XG90_9ARAC|nr:hypothetical protein TNIN_440241 [Trichonephila inaurata madagascariensis]
MNVVRTVLCSGVASCVVRGNRSLYFLFCLAVEGNNDMVYDCLFDRGSFPTSDFQVQEPQKSAQVKPFVGLNSKMNSEVICFNRIGVNKFEYNSPLTPKPSRLLICVSLLSYKFLKPTIPVGFLTGVKFTKLLK